MPDKQTCSICGAELPADAHGGLCVPCALCKVLDHSPAIERGLQEQSVRPAVSEKAGDQIGRYGLREQLGEGGCGIVYLADQEEPVRRRVALKVIKPGMDTKHVLARFEAERQALALMDHPNIAKVLDAGATPAGRPYFVMEWVKGIRITDYCDSAKLSTRERLRLFIEVCHAVQHAHQKGVIHRDIKPSNIVVNVQDGLATPKVIDFGIAKATNGQPLTDKTLFTAFEQFIGTPAYMSPEQAAGELDIDTRSDIYALGVLLYELLTGKTPFEAKELLTRGIEEIRRIIQEKDPPSPSMRLSTLEARERTEVAERRCVEPPALLGLIRGDLDWIVMKALEKERGRRYETANALALDIERFLNDEVVRARPPSQSYRLRKLIRRHKLVFAAGLAVATSLLAGITVSTSLWMRERAERQRANEQSAIATAVSDFLQNDLLRQASSESQADAAHQPNPELTVREALDRAAQHIGARFKDQPRVESTIRSAIGDAFAGLGDAQRAVPHLQRVVELLQLQNGKNDIDTIGAIDSLAQAYQDAGQIEKALPLFEETMKWGHENLPPNDPDRLIMMNNLASAYRQAGKFDQAVPLFEEALKLKISKIGRDDPSTITTMGNLAVAYQAAGRIDQAVQLFEETLVLQKAKLGPDHPTTLATMNNLAGAYRAAGRLDQSLPLLEETLQLDKTRLGPEHRRTLNTMCALACNYQAVGRLNDALALFDDTLIKQKATLGPEHPDTLTTMGNLAGAYQDVGKFDQSLALFDQTLATQKIRLGRDHPETLITMYHFARAYQGAGKMDQSLSMYRDALDLCKAKLGLRHPITDYTMAGFGACLLAHADFAAAEKVLHEVLDLRQTAGRRDWKTFYLQSQLGSALLGLKRYADAEPLLVQGYAGLVEREKNIPADSKTAPADAGNRLVQLYQAWGKPTQAAEWQQKLQAAVR